MLSLTELAIMGLLLVLLQTDSHLRPAFLGLSRGVTDTAGLADVTCTRYCVRLGILLCETICEVAMVYC
jgi:hypothetical protein